MKMLIDKIKLKLLLEQKRDYIKHSVEGVDTIISAVIFMVSLCCSNFNAVFGINKIIIETVAWILAIIIFLYGIIKAIRSFGIRYDQNMLYHDIENIDEVVHKFSIVAIKDNYNEFANRFLLYYDNAWDCWFFFSFHTSEYQNEENIVQRLSNKLKIESKYIKVHYISDRYQPKFSEKDRVNKLYQHSLYQGYISSYSALLKEDEFELDGVKYRWWTIDEMEKNCAIMEKNRDVVSFVKEKIN